MPKEKSWFSMKALSGGAAEIEIYEEIGCWGVTASDFRRDLKSLGDVSSITLKLNSPGGSVGEGNAIFNMLKKHSAHVTVEIESLALSMGSLVAMAGDTISIAANGMMMLHNPWCVAVGDADEMRKAAEVSDKFKAGMVRAYSARSGMSEDEISALMDDETWLDAEEAVEFGFADEVTDAVELAAHFDLTAFQRVPEQLLLSGKSGTEKRKDVMPAKKVADKTPAEPVGQDVDDLVAKAAADAAEAALAAEAARQTEIRASFEKYVDDHRDLLDACLQDRSITVAEANAKLLKAIGEGREPISGRIRIVEDEVDRFRAGAVAALEMRAGRRDQDEKNEFRSYSLYELAVHSLKMRGVSLRGKSRMDIVGAAFTHSTSDFPYLMENVLGKELQRAYGSFAETWRNIAYVSSVPDFKVNRRIRLGTFNSLDIIEEGGEYTSGSFSEEYENIQAATRGKKIALTRQSIINDDLGGLMRIATKIGRAAARTVGDDVYDVINANGNMTDGTAIFASSKGNLAGTGAAISVATLSAAKKAMRTQKDPDGNDYLDIQPSILLVPVALEDHANTIMMSETDFSQSNSRKPNIHRNTMTVVSDPRLDGASATAWYTIADPMDVPLLEVAFLDGNQTPYMESRNGFDIDGVEWKVRLDYGVSAIDRRGGYKNPGA